MSKLIVAGISTSPASRWPDGTAYLQIFYHNNTGQAFSFSTGEVWQPSLDTFYREIPCTVASNIVTVSSVELDTTTDVVGPSAVRLTMRVLDATRSENDPVQLAQSWEVPTALEGLTAVTYEMLRQHNTPAARQLSDNSQLSRTQWELMLAGAVAVGNPATTSAIGRVKASAAPTDAASPTALVEGDGRAGKSSANYASLSAAVTAIGSTPTDLYITSAFASGATVNVPATVTLRFVSGGSLVLGSGHVVTVLGPLEAPPRQIFSGTGTVSFQGNFYQEQIHVEWWGAKGDASFTSGSGTDSTAAFNAAIMAVPRGGGIDIVGLGGKYRITSSINLINNVTYNYRSAITFIGRAGVMGASGINQASFLIWDGNTTDPMIKNYSRENKWIGWVFTVANGKTCNVLMGIDKASIDGGTSYIGTRQHIEDCLFTDGSGYGGTGAVVYGVQIGQNVGAQAGADNLEFNSIRSSNFYLNGTTARATAGIYIASNTRQSKGNIVEDVLFSGSTYAIYTSTGSFTASKCSFTGHDVVVRLGGYTDNIEMDFINEEGCGRFLESTNSTQRFSWPVSIRNSRLMLDGLNADGEFIKDNSPGLSLQNVNFGDSNYSADFKIRLTGASTSPVTLTLDSVALPNDSYPFIGGYGRVSMKHCTGATSGGNWVALKDTVIDVTPSGNTPTDMPVEFQSGLSMARYAQVQSLRGNSANVPTVAVGTGAGSASGGTATLDSTATDLTGTVTVTTGSGAGATSSAVATITFASRPKDTARVFLAPANAAAAALTGTQQVSYTTSTGGGTAISWRIVSGSAALGTSTTYIWNYLITE